MSLSVPAHAERPFAMDYAFLRARGIEYIQNMSASRWTDFNSHDPGVTLLEQLCYALTDLSYRIDYPLTDILYHPEAQTKYDLPLAESILPCNPLTINDWRKVLLDIPGVQNVWMEPLFDVDRDNGWQYTLSYQQAAASLFLHKNKTQNIDNVFSENISLKGLYRVLIDISDSEGIDGSQVLAQVKHCLHKQRNIGEDFSDIAILPVQKIPIQADIEIETVDNAEALLAEIYAAIAEYLSPSLRFLSKESLVQKKMSVDVLYEGPLLEQGFIDSDRIESQQRRNTLRSSDLIQVIMQIEGVRTVTSISLGTEKEAWSLSLDNKQSPRFDSINSRIVLKRQYLAVTVNHEQVSARYQQARLALQIKHRMSSKNTKRSEHPLQSGRERHIADYYSFQNQLPKNYGIGEWGLPASTSKKRQAQAKQLKAYLLFFDQLFSNYFSQLAHMRDLFSFGQSANNTSNHEDDSVLSNQHCYFTQALKEPPLDLETLLPTADTAHHWYDEAQTDKDSRQHRFLNHLLARFAEQFTDYALLRFSNTNENDHSAQTIKVKQAFLQNYPNISRQRGTGIDYSQKPEEAVALSGLEQRLRYKLAIADNENCQVVEHILLRPIEGDEKQTQALLSDLDYADPYSLSISVVFATQRSRFTDTIAFERYQDFVEKTLDEEIPAHLAFSVHWLDTDAWYNFKSIYYTWCIEQSHFVNQSSAISANILQQQKRRLRASRDALIDILGIGQTYPLQDIPLATTELTVAFAKAARIILPESQIGVYYTLLDKAKNPVLIDEGNGSDKTIGIEGNGAEIILVTPAIREDIQYFIQAEKLESRKKTLLHQYVTIKVGLDVGLSAFIAEAELLDSRLSLSSSIADEAARLISYNEGVQIIVRNSQEGVEYSLVYFDDQATQHTASESSVTGNLADIHLSSITFQEDVDLRILATKTFDAVEQRETQQALLTTVLPLKVRANPSTDLQLKFKPEKAIIPFKSELTVGIKNTQSSVSYRLYLHPLEDNEFRYFNRDSSNEMDLLSIPVNNDFTAYMVKPQYQSVWQTPEHYQVVSDYQTGTGNRYWLYFNLESLTEDSVIIVQAEKQHKQADGSTLSSQVMLQNSIAVLIAPNDKQALQLNINTEKQGSTEFSRIQFENGEAGVFYRLDYQDKRLGMVYFHQHDTEDHTFNKGLEQLRLGIDFVVVDKLSGDQQQSLAERYPEKPELLVEGIIEPEHLSITAIKARTKVETLLTAWSVL